MPAPHSSPWHCALCGRTNDGCHQTCASCGKLALQPSSHLSHPTKKKRLRSFLLVLGAGGLLFALYFSYTPLHTISTFQMNNSVSSVAWSPDSQDFAAVTDGQDMATGEAMMNLWSTRTGQKLLTYTFSSPQEGLSQLAWAPDGRSFAIAWSDGNVEIWEAKAESDSSRWFQSVSFRMGDRQNFQNAVYTTGLAWSAGGKRLQVSYSDGPLYAWDVLNEHLLPPTVAPQVGGKRSSIFALSPHGTQAILSSQQTRNNDKTYVLWDIATGKESPLLVTDDSAPSVAWSPDEHTVAVGNGTEVLIWQWNKQKNTWSLVHSMTVAPDSGVYKLAWSPDGKRLAVADGANVTRLWSVENEHLIGPPFPLFDYPLSMADAEAETDNAITTLAWSPNGKYLLSGNSPGQVRLQDVL